MSHPKRRAVRAIGLLAAAGEGVAIGLAAGSPGRCLESGRHGRPAGNRHQHRPGCPGRALTGGES
jgi:hypothetical protein